MVLYEIVETLGDFFCIGLGERQRDGPRVFRPVFKRLAAAAYDVLCEFVAEPLCWLYALFAQFPGNDLFKKQFRQICESLV
jgi:hypothetical protein